jgi:hypothetical protein
MRVSIQLALQQKAQFLFISNVSSILETRASLRATFPAGSNKKFLAPAAL